MRRAVYHTLTGQQLLDEVVDESTCIRKPCVRSLTPQRSFSTALPALSADALVNPTPWEFPFLSIRIKPLLSARNLQEARGQDAPAAPPGHRLEEEEEEHDSG